MGEKIFLLCYVGVCALDGSPVSGGTSKHVGKKVFLRDFVHVEDKQPPISASIGAIVKLARNFDKYDVIKPDQQWVIKERDAIYRLTKLECDDYSTEWFKMPKCKEKISSHCPKCKSCVSVKEAAGACRLIEYGIPDMLGVQQINATKYLTKHCGLTLQEVDLIVGGP